MGFYSSWVENLYNIRVSLKSDLNNGGYIMSDTAYRDITDEEINTNQAEWIGSSSEEEIPDFNALRDNYEFMSFETKAGDAVIFNTAIIHTSHGNFSPSRRRLALSTRWLGDDACWDPRSGTDPIVTQEHVSLEPGTPARDDKAFPLVWEAH